MGVKILHTTFKRFARAPALRPDFRLQSFLTEKFPFKTRPFRECVLSLYNGANIGPESYATPGESNLIYPTVNNIKPYGLELREVTFLEEGTKVATRLQDQDLVLGRSGTVGLAKAWDTAEVNQIVGKSVESVPSGYLIVVKLDRQQVIPRFAEYYLQTARMRRYFDVFGVGKSQKNISQPDVLRIPFPVISRQAQDDLLQRIQPIELEIAALRERVSDPAATINQVFTKAFQFNMTEFEKLSQKRIFPSDLIGFLNNPDLRCSSKFHREAARYVRTQLRSRSKKCLKDYLSEDIVLGATISPSEYDDAGDMFYVSMSSIKSWSFDAETARTTTDAFASENGAKRVQTNDIIMARSGEGTIGKVAVIPEGVEGIHSDFTMRIRLRAEEYDPLFAYYYFRTRFFQYLIEVEKKGLGNNTNIFPVQLREFPVLDARPELQLKVVATIRKKFGEQEQIRDQISAKRGEITRLIERALTDAK